MNTQTQLTSTTKDKIAKIERTFDTAKEICKTLAPLTERAQRRLLTYFSDLVTDPDTDAGMSEAQILKQVHEMLELR